MNNHVVSKETAILLKENGFLQETEFYWAFRSFENDWKLETYSPAYIDGKRTKRHPDTDNKNFIAAPLATEILERLPWAVDYKDTLYPIKIFKFDSGGYAVIYQDATKSIHGETLVEALSKMYVYLSKHNLSKE